MGAYRFTFNKIVDYKKEEFESCGGTSGYMKARKDWKARLVAEAPWIDEIPAHTIYGAMMDADRAYLGALKKRKQGMSADLPRCRKKTQRSCFILGNAVAERGIYPRLIGNLRAAEALPRHPQDCRLVHDLDNRWYLSVPHKVSCNHAENQGICAIDPGVRTFATVVSDRSCFKIGTGGFSRIVRLALCLDDLLSRATKARYRQRKSMRRAAGRLRVRIRNLVDDLHWQTIGYLCRNFKTIVIPDGNFTSACRKARRRIGRKTVRSLLTYSFARFRDRLRGKAEELGLSVLTVDEAYTSKTANWTGEIVHSLGGAKQITSQGVTVDRDLNGALGILLKALADRPVMATNHNCTLSHLVADGKEK